MLWTEKLEAAEECDSCGQPIKPWRAGPGLVVFSDEHGAPRRAICVTCLGKIGEEAHRQFSTVLKMLREVMGC